jgi:hypothetical protein
MFALWMTMPDRCRLGLLCEALAFLRQILEFWICLPWFIIDVKRIQAPLARSMLHPVFRQKSQ